MSLNDRKPFADKQEKWRKEMVKTLNYNKLVLETWDCTVILKGTVHPKY